MYSIPRNCLKAALVCSAKADARYYLNGVLFTRNINGQCALVSTDGHRLFAGLLPDLGEDGPIIGQPLEVIIPRDVVAKESKGKLPAILKPLTDEQWILGDTIFTPVDAKYPDWQRVTPIKLSGEIGQYNPDYLADAQIALRTWEDKKTRVYQVNGNGIENAGAMCCETAYVVIMPFRTGEPCTPFAWNNAPIKMPEAIAA